ncbi:unnamed protein product, partial [Ixodes hexagonus]
TTRKHNAHTSRFQLAQTLQQPFFGSPTAGSSRERGREKKGDHRGNPHQS